MKLPNREKAIVPKAKIVAYLLSSTHPVGGSKAKFFRAFGFDESNTDLLEHALLNVAASVEVESIKENERGTKYVLVGEIQTPSGRRVTVRTIWMVERGEENPRFVTAYPV